MSQLRLFKAVPALLLASVLLLLPANAYGVSVSRAELKSGQLRVEGQSAAAQAQITVTTTPSTSVAQGTADSSGAFRISASPYRSDTCRVTVSDGGRTPDAQATLSGCTPASSPPPSSPPPPTSEPPPPTGSCTIVPSPPMTTNVGTLSTFYYGTSGCRTGDKTLEWKVVSGAIPPNMRVFTQGVASGGITGTPTTEGIFRFTLEVRDQTGARDREAFQITVEPPRPLVVSNQSDALSPGTVGSFYCCGNLFADGGVPDYQWTLVSGQLPPGLQLTASPGRITGTPTTAGTFAFTVRVTDSRGATAQRTFSITIS